MGRKTKRKKEAEMAEEPTADEEPPPVPEEPGAEAAEPAEDADSSPPLQDQVAELTAKWLRAQADYQNLRRRGQLDYEAGLQRALQPLLEELLLVLDYLDMALATPTSSDEAKNLALGVEMTRTKLVQALERADVKPIPTDGEFDPARHEATETREEPNVEPGTIVATVRRGYTWREMVLRHAHVVVAAGPEGEPEAEPAAEESED